MNILCTICARGGSKGLKNKSLRKIKGKPLIFYTLKVAKKSNIFDEIAVSTDSKKIKNTVNRYGKFCWYLRDKKLAKDHISKRLVLIDLLKKSEIKFKKKFDIIVDLDPSSPLRSVTDLKQSLLKFKKNKNDLLVSVNECTRNPYFNMIEINNDKIQIVKKGKSKIFSRQSAPKVYDMNASIHIRSRNILLKQKSLKSKFTNKSGIFLMPKKRSIDIDGIFEFNLIKKIIQ